ncbi:hypothetical protein H4Q26_000660 [Puccinia striiformis f. sp. tritici PST-130]|nr:hypothetical protein H4Q26_000660 [Puccinia striiformis f. sp. tritici PST-130]
MSRNVRVGAVGQKVDGQQETIGKQQEVMLNPSVTGADSHQSSTRARGVSVQHEPHQARISTLRLLCQHVRNVQLYSAPTDSRLQQWPAGRKEFFHPVGYSQLWKLPTLVLSCGQTTRRNFVQSRTGKIGWLHARKVAQQWHSIKLPNDGAVNTIF